jgi:CubicO group peptidase (beta-lactamase class C family)
VRDTTLQRFRAALHVGARPARRAVALAAVLALSSCGKLRTPDDLPSTIVNGAVGAELDRYLSRTAAFGMGGAFLVARGSDILLAKGYGIADTLTGAPVTAQSVFYAASITKQFTAAAILLLVQDGKLAVTDSLPRFFADVPIDKRGITVHQLLTHSAGITSYHTPAQTTNDRRAWVRGLLATRLDFKPGSRATYSNAGFSLLAAIVEEVAGEPYIAFVHRRIFAPAGLTHTAFVAETAAWDSSRLAYGIGAGIERDPRRFVHGWGSLGASEVMTTVLDLWQWELALRGRGILSDSTQAVMFRPSIALVPGIDYGYGWRLQRTGRGTRVNWASGINLSYSAMYRRYVDEDVTILFLSHVAHYGQAYRDILFPSARRWDDGPVGRIAFGEGYTSPPWFVEEAADSLRKYAGTYRFASGGALVVATEADHLRIEPWTQDIAELFLSRPADSLMAPYDSLDAQVRRAVESSTALSDSTFGLGPIFQEDATFALPHERLGRFVSIDGIVTIPMMSSGGENRANDLRARAIRTRHAANDLAVVGKRVCRARSRVRGRCASAVSAPESGPVRGLVHPAIQCVAGAIRPGFDRQSGPNPNPGREGREHRGNRAATAVNARWPRDHGK